MNTEFQKYLDEMLPKVTFDDTPIKFKITIEEQCSQTFEVEAANIEEAMKIAEQKYADGTFVLDNPNLTYKCMMAEDEYGAEATEWVEF